ncbi:cobalt ECF transporter T component CbiQ [Zavarzinia compransoris]|uniref:cobalt ECF transporter T component CbiQ n=1 Tax=Zavarzinia marina TaxID=2911065 RepID=UPI001F3BE690|nr:cobalt ECF transporter T component CbiQ [Zavarzinia marina]MCF4165586.1 cobalt ECF transporter T component CbiQ [Zavarzinia marina]
MIAGVAPAARLFAALVLVTAIAALRHPMAQGVALIGAFVLVLLAGRPPAVLLHRLRHVEGFLVLLLVMLPFTVEGTSLVAIGPLDASAEGLWRAFGIVMKVNAAAALLFALIGDLDPVRLGHAARRLGVPLRLVQVFVFTARYVDLFRDEIRRLREAMRARAFTAGTSLHAFRSYGNMAGMVLVRALERAKRVEEAMRCRAFDGRLPAIGPPESRAGAAACTAMALVAAGTLLALDLMP